MVTSKAFDKELSQDDPIEETKPEIVVDTTTGIVLSGSGLKTIQPHEALKLIDGVVVENKKFPDGKELKYALGDKPIFNVRTRFIEIGNKEYNLDQLSRFYLQLSNHKQRWSKEMTIDAVITIAEFNEYDPIATYLENLNQVEPLPDKDWFNLDRFLFDIDDPIAKAFMPRYLVAAVKRACQPSCQYRQIPVLIGSQNIGKTELGKALFGKYYGGGLSGKFDIDDVTILERLWCCELAELDGITRKSQIEAFKDFISRTEDFTRRKYGKGTIRIPRRSVFWGTSNTPPLNDSSGSTRFVCIPLPNKKLPIERVKNAFDSIWIKAYWEYRKGLQCYSTEEEMILINDRNSDFEYVDSWFEKIEQFLEETTLEVVTTEKIHKKLDLEARHLGNQQYSTRIRKIMDKCGWKYGRYSVGGKQERGYKQIERY
tara:strand:- start:877 stop:2160 length:1284 start_codon:yes stop_codon:yes gene_type:complete